MFKSKDTSSIVHSRSVSVIVRWKTHCPKGQSPIPGSGTSRSEPRWPIFPYDPRSSHTIGHQTALTSLNLCSRDLLLRKRSLSGQGLASNHQFLYWGMYFLLSTNLRKLHVQLEADTQETQPVWAQLPQVYSSQSGHTCSFLLSCFPTVLASWGLSEPSDDLCLPVVTRAC